MALKRSLDAYLERTKVVVSLGPDDEEPDLATADQRLIADLGRASASYRVWTWATAFVALTLAFIGLLTQGNKELGSLLGAGGVAVLLFKIGRHRFTADIAIALLKTAPGARERRRIVSELDAKL